MLRITLQILVIFLGISTLSWSQTHDEPIKSTFREKDLNPDTIPSLIKALGDKDPVIRRDAVSKLSKFGPKAKDAITALGRACFDPDPYVSQAVPQVLAKIGADAVPVLAKIYDSNNSRAIELASYALASMGPTATAAVPTLIRVLKNKPDHDRQYALNVIANIGASAEAAVPVLISALGENDKGIQEGSSRALGMIGPAAIPALVKALKEGAPQVRQRAARALEIMGPKAEPAISPLIEAFKDKDVQAVAYTALGKIGPAAVPFLLQSLKDPDKKIRLNTIFALSSMGPGAQDAVGALIGILNDKDLEIRGVASNALGFIGPAAVPSLIEALKDKDPVVREGAAGAFWQMRSAPKTSVPPLIEALIDENKTIRALSYRALERIGSDARYALVEALADNPEKIKALVESGISVDYRDPNAATPLIVAVKRGHIDAVKILLGKEADVNAQTLKGETALMMAAWKRKIGIARILIDRGASPIMVDENGWTAMTIAAYQGDVEFIQVLLEHHAVVDEPTGKIGTPLMMAAKQGHLDVVKVLLAAGANPRIHTQAGVTALTLAEKKGHQDMVEILKEVLKSPAKPGTAPTESTFSPTSQEEGGTPRLPFSKDEVYKTALRNAYQSKNASDQTRWFKQAAKLRPDAILPIYELIALLYRENKEEEATKLRATLHKLHPDCSDAEIPEPDRRLFERHKVELTDAQFESVRSRTDVNQEIIHSTRIRLAGKIWTAVAHMYRPKGSLTIADNCDLILLGPHGEKEIIYSEEGDCARFDVAPLRVISGDSDQVLIEEWTGGNSQIGEFKIFYTPTGKPTDFQTILNINSGQYWGSTAGGEKHVNLTVLPAPPGQPHRLKIESWEYTARPNYFVDMQLEDKDYAGTLDDTEAAFCNRHEVAIYSWDGTAYRVISK